jgi:hypothetical protein
LLDVMDDNHPKDQPQVPVVHELPGLSNFNVSSWNALAAPGKTHKAVVDRLSTEVDALSCGIRCVHDSTLCNAACNRAHVYHLDCVTSLATCCRNNACSADTFPL